MDLMRIGQRVVTDLHARLYRLTNGRIGRHFGRVENILLTTTGRKSGKARITPLTVTVDGERLILVASNGGAPKHPDWYLNLTADPGVTLQRGGTLRQFRARTATAAERPALWAKVLDTYRGYDGYQKRTSREIPLVVCEPSPAR
jgi:deazaflavin-dependent oxidoreductase (nitroreductase family)